MSRRLQDGSRDERVSARALDDEGHGECATNESESLVVDLSLHGRERLVNLGYTTVRAMFINRKGMHTFLSDELNLRDEANIGRRSHGVGEEDTAVTNRAFVAQNNWPASAQAHSIRCQRLVRYASGSAH